MHNSALNRSAVIMWFHFPTSRPRPVSSALERSMLSPRSWSSIRAYMYQSGALFIGGLCLSLYSRQNFSASSRVANSFTSSIFWPQPRSLSIIKTFISFSKKPLTFRSRRDRANARRPYLQRYAPTRLV